MATSQEVSNRIAYIKAQIESCLQRCQNAPYSSFDRIKKVQKLQDEAAAISTRAADEILNIETPTRTAFQKSSQELNNKQIELNETQRRQQSTQDLFQANAHEHNARIHDAATRGVDQIELNKQWQITNSEHNKNNAEINRRHV